MKKVISGLLNEGITFNSVRVIASNGDQLGIMSIADALAKADEEGLDLLCVAKKAEPPVCKILDYGKFNFEEQKKQREAKKHQQETEIKALRLSPVIDTNDFNTKLKQAAKWLESGLKVKVDMRFKGRMMTRQEVGQQIMANFKDSLNSIAEVEKETMEGNTLSCTLKAREK